MSDEGPERPAGEAIIGYAFAFKNADLKFDWYGSPREILEWMAAAKISPRDAAHHIATGIKANDVLKIGSSGEFHGGPHAAGVMFLLDALAAENWPEAGNILRNDPELLTADHDGTTVPLIANSSIGNVEAVRFLLTHGAAINRGADLGMTALHWAAAAGQFEVAKVLLAAGADLTIQNWFLLTPLQLAILNSHDKLVRLLSGGDPNKVTPVTPMSILKAMGCH